MYGYFLEHPNDRAPEPRSDVQDFGTPSEFVPQKTRALERLKPRNAMLMRLVGILATG
jgi:hypothetical protein